MWGPLFGPELEDHRGVGKRRVPVPVLRQGESRLPEPLTVKGQRGAGRDGLDGEAGLDHGCDVGSGVDQQDLGERQSGAASNAVDLLEHVGEVLAEHGAETACEREKLVRRNASRVRQPVEVEAEVGANAVAKCAALDQAEVSRASCDLEHRKRGIGLP